MRRVTLADPTSASPVRAESATGWTRCHEVLWRRIGAELVVVGPTPDEPMIVGRPGQLVWDLLGRRRPFEDLVDAIVEATGAERERVSSDVAGLLDVWQGHGWVERWG